MTLTHIPVTPAEAGPHDRLEAEDLRLLQQKALREWRQSDWLATHDPRGYEAIVQQDPSVIRVDLGGGVGDSQQIPGCLVIGWPDGPDTLAQTDERRMPDFAWVPPGNFLPFATASIDELHALRAPAAIRPMLAREIARVMKLGGRVETYTNPGSAFEREGETRWYQCTQRRDSLDDVAPLLIDEKVLGQPIRRERA